ncbi:MAG: hypothetical protein Q7J48_11905 [Nocardioides sp.]|nr:hypothetical protein [Nocardioides sp.]
MWSPKRWLPASAGLAAVLLVSACGSPAGDDAERKASSLRGAIARDDGAAACAVLSARTLSELEQSSDKPCAQAILEETLPTGGAVSQVRVFGSMAQVRYDDETVFLSRYGGGWRVSAAGCTESASGIYDCVIKGG